MVAISPFPGPSRLRRSLARSRETHFTRPNRRACSQAKIALVSVHRLTEQLYAMSTLKSRYNDLSLRVEFCTSFSFIYNTIRQRQTRPQPCSAENIRFGGLNFTYLFQTAEIQAQRSTKVEVFPRESILRFIHQTEH